MGEVQKIVASDRETYGYYYGESVAISDGFVAIGAYEANSLAEDGVTTLEQTGAIYMYEENESGVWFEVAKLVASDREEYDYLGYYIDLDDNVLVASNYEKNSYTGQAYVFEKNLKAFGWRPKLFFLKILLRNRNLELVLLFLMVPLLSDLSI